MVRCAQVSPLSGGSRDLTPPKLINAVPKNASVNFSGKIIELQFDEYVQLKNIQSQFIVTPGLSEMPEIAAKGKKVLIKLKTDLAQNTTYRFYFGNSIADMHESNAISNFEYVFSTGDYIDSSFIAGNVFNADNLKPEKDIIIGLYDVNEISDSLPYKTKPLYFTKSTAAGDFRITYLPEKTKYNVFAFADKNNNMLYDGEAEAIGFLNVNAETRVDSALKIYLFKQAPAKLFIKKAASLYYGIAYIVYNKEVFNKARAYNTSEQNYIYSPESTNDTCEVRFHSIYDTLKLIIEHGSISRKDTVNISVLSRQKHDILKNKNKLTLTLDPLQNGLMPYYLNPEIVFNKWQDTLKVDKNKIKLVSKTDSLIKSESVISFKSVNRFELKNKLKQGHEYKLVIEKGAFCSVDSTISDSLVLSFKISEKELYGQVKAVLFFPKKENYIVQLLNLQEKVVAEKHISISLSDASEQTIEFNTILPGQYFLKVIEDVNGNKKWDSGDFNLKKQPETIFFNTQSVKIMADWDAEIEWKIN